MQRLDDAHVRATERARTVSSYPGYMFTLAGFATDMGDKHIWSRSVFADAYPLWAGIILSKRGNAYVVADTDEEQSELRGAQLVSCDSVSAAELAKKNLGGFRADWSVGAQQVQAAPWLLVDEQNPIHQSALNMCVRLAGKATDGHTSLAANQTGNAAATFEGGDRSWRCRFWRSQGGQW